METFEQLCQQRRSIRKYTAQPIEKEKLDYILRCALMSPSGKRLNPWEFYVLTREETLRRLSGCRTYGSGMFDTAMAAIVGRLIDRHLAVGRCDCGTRYSARSSRPGSRRMLVPSVSA